MKKIAKIVAQLLLVMFLSTLFIQLFALADGPSLPLYVDKYQEAGVVSGDMKGYVADDGSIAEGDFKDGAVNLIDVIIRNALKYIKYITAAVGILMITVLGYNMVTHGSDEENITNSKKGLTYVVIALIIISMSEELARMFDMGNGSVLQDTKQILKRVKIFDRQVEMFMIFVKYVIGSYAVLMIIKSSLSMITAGGDEEKTTQAKKKIGMSLGGLMMIYVAEIFINKVFYITDKTKYSSISGMELAVNANEGVKQLVGITNLVISFVGPIAVILFIVAGLLYATAGGEEEKLEKAKRVLITTIIGIVIIYGAFALISTIVSGSMGITDIPQ